MKYVKENLAVVISAAVAVLILLYALVPGVPYTVSALKEDLVGRMQARYNDTKDIKTKAGTQVQLPGIEVKSYPTQMWLDDKSSLIDSINKQGAAVEKEAQQRNSMNRVNSKGEPLLPLPTQRNYGGETGIAQPNYLPRIARGADGMSFKTLYGQQIRLWTGLLAKGALVEINDESTMPPKLEKLKADWDAKQAAAAALLPGGGMQPGGGMMGGANTPEQQQVMNNWIKGQVMNRATGLHMYIDRDPVTGLSAFQRRDWLGKDDSPNEQQIFEALVDSWFQGDLVKAILLINTTAETPSGYDVGRAPIKRLTRVVIGNNARTRFLNTGVNGNVVVVGSSADPGPLFLTSTNAQNTGTNAGGQNTGPSVAAGNAGIPTTGPAGGVKLPDTPNATDYTMGMTGRSAGHTYDVAYMSVVMDIDPTYLFKFMEAFYQRNMGYTIVNMQTRTVDPLERVSNGYFYGEGQVVEVEMLFECILFRSWSEPLMPDPIRRTLGGVDAPN